MIRAVISDFGGVLTTPLHEAFAAVQEESGIPSEAIGAAMVTVTARNGANPLWELECGRMTESDFMELLGDQVTRDLGREVHMHEFSERWFAALEPNEKMLRFLAELRTEGRRLALLTNNVREWEPRWRAMLPVDELFEVVIDSAFVGMRKPDAAIYELACERLGVSAAECVFIDDVEANAAAAAELGMTGVRFRDAEQAIAEVRAALVA